MDINEIYMIGARIQYLRGAALDKTFVKNETHIFDNLIWVLGLLKEYKLSQQTQEEIEKIVEQFEKSYEEDEVVTDADSYLIIEKIKLWDDRIKKELSETMVVEVFTDGTLNPKKLLDGGGGFFSDDLWGTLSDIQKSDINDACNCLLTRSWTPAVMISLRASEDSIRRFYNFKTGNIPQRKGWKSILNELSTIEDINKSLLGYLDYIREIRNAAEHPDEIFNQMDAERVFHQVVNMIAAISQELSQKEPSN